MDCRVLCPAAAAVGAGEWWSTRGGVGKIGGAVSYESEHDLALMVSDFLENGGSGGAESWYSSDSDSGFSDLAHQVDKLTFYKHSGVQFESDLLSVVHSLMLSINSIDLGFIKPGPCNASCIRFSLVKLLRLSGYDAAVCMSRWQGSGKVPKGDHEYIDVVNYNNSGNSERLIIDIDFRSHFEIARAVDSYNRILKSLPVVYVGSLARLKQYLEVMVDAARSSLKQHAMPLPPWRSLPYLQSKWLSSYQRLFSPDTKDFNGNDSSDHKLCCGQLKRLQLLIHSETEERFTNPLNGDSNWRSKLERHRHSLLWKH